MTPINDPGSSRRGHTLEDWLGGLSSVSYVALLGSAGTAALMLALICESNFLRWEDVLTVGRSEEGLRAWWCS